MAICLDDLKKNKKSSKDSLRSAKPRSLRPWESYDEIEGQTRTVGAQEAVVKAREIVKLNNEMVEELREGVKSAEKLKELDKKLDTPNRGVKQAGFYVLIGASMRLTLTMR